MEVVKLCDTPLCNAEVLHFLREKRQQLPSKRPTSSRGGQAATVVLETLTHLEKYDNVTNLTPERVSNFNKKIKANNLELTDAEKLHLMNHCPTVIFFVDLFAISRKIIVFPIFF